MQFAPGQNVETDEEHRLVLLQDVLERYADTPLSIDVKENCDRLIGHVTRIVRASGRTNLVWGSFHHAVIGKLHREHPDVPIMFSALDCIKLYALFWTGLLPFVPLRRDFFFMAMPRQ